MSLDSANKLKSLLQGAQDGKLFFSSWLRENGYSDQLVMTYRNSGWLTMLHKGVMCLAGSKLNIWGALSSYNEQLDKTFRVAAHSALELSGFNHYVPMGKPVLMVHHNKKDRVPIWMNTVSFDNEIKLFSTQIFSEQHIYTHIKNDFPLLVSSPEQAFLECLLLAPQYYSLMDLYYIMEQLTTLRSDVLLSLLENCTNNKVKRLFLFMAEKANHYWYEELDLSKINIGNGVYQIVKDGVYLSKYKITIPKELNDYK
jgi:hypothetical protein